MYRSEKHGGRHIFFNSNQGILEKHGLYKMFIILFISLFIIASVPLELFSVTAHADGNRNSNVWLGYNDGYTDTGFAWSDGEPWTGCIELDAAKLGAKAGGDISEIRVSTGCDGYGFYAAPFDVYYNTGAAGAPTISGATLVDSFVGNSTGWGEYTLSSPQTTPDNGDSAYLMIQWHDYSSMYPAGFDTDNTDDRGAWTIDHGTTDTWILLDDLGYDSVYGIDVHIDKYPPIVHTNESTGVEQTNATLCGYLEDDGSENCSVWFEYGTTTGYGNTVYPFSPDFTTEHTIDGSFGGALSVYACDVDGDGDIDVLGAAFNDDDITWWENDGSESFTEHTIDSSFTGACDVYACDVDGDGDIDVLGAAEIADDITWWENDGSESFTEHTIDSSFNNAFSVYACDVDGDGDIDVLGAAVLDNDITWWENDGSESFTEHTIDSSFTGACDVYACDVDGDGDIDVLGAAFNDDDITWWENDGSESFTEHTIDSSFTDACDVYACDVDGDGDVDVLGAARDDDDITWWENDGSESFTEHTIDSSFNNAFSVYACDVDGDGDIDVLGAAVLDNDITWWENNQSKPSGTRFNKTITGLNPGTTYHYRTFAKNSAGTSYGNDKTFLTKPSQLTEFGADTQSPYQINLSWNNGNGGDGAYIEYAISSPFSPWNPGDGIKITTDGYAPGTNSLHTGLNPETEYYYKAWAYAEDEGIKSNGTQSYPFGNSQTTDNMTEDENQPPECTNPNPLDGAADQPVEYLTWSVMITDAEGDCFDWSIECSNGQSRSKNDDVNGTKELPLDGLGYDTQYIIWVNATDPDGSGKTTTEIFTFTTANGPPQTAYVDDDYKYSTPGFGIYKFLYIQHGVDHVMTGGTVEVAKGYYSEPANVIIINTEGIAVKGPDIPSFDSAGAIIEDNMVIDADGVSIRGFTLEPSAGNPAVWVTDTVDASTININYNNFLKECISDTLGIENQDTNMLDARFNWWGTPDGPSGLVTDPITGRRAEGFGVRIVDNGPVRFDSWVGVDAEATASSTAAKMGNSIGFDASDSFACYLDGSPNEYIVLWDFDDGLQSTNLQPNHVFDSPGTYYVSLRVQASDTLLHPGFMYDWDNITITVFEPDTPLSCSADGENLGGYEGLRNTNIQFYGAAVGGEPSYTYQWDFDDNSGTMNGQEPVHKFSDAGTYTVALTVIDSAGSIATDTATVTINEPQPLSINMNAPETGNTGKELSFAATASGGMTPYTYAWDFDDGTTSSGSSPIHVYKEFGTYTVAVSITDYEGSTLTETKEILITDGQDIEEVVIESVSSAFARIQATIRTGDNPADCNIMVDGMVFLGGENSVELPAQVTETMQTPFTLGFGNVDITVTANDVTEEYTAFLVGPFFLNLQEN